MSTVFIELLGGLRLYYGLDESEIGSHNYLTEILTEPLQNVCSLVVIVRTMLPFGCWHFTNLVDLREEILREAKSSLKGEELHYRVGIDMKICQSADQQGGGANEWREHGILNAC